MNEVCPKDPIALAGCFRQRLSSAELIHEHAPAIPLIWRHLIAVVLLTVAVVAIFHSGHVVGRMSHRGVLLWSAVVLVFALLASGWCT